MQQEQLKVAGDVVAGGVAAATLMAWIPPVAALVSLVYALIRLYETETVQKLITQLRK